jgi:hypothetical protein
MMRPSASARRVLGLAVAVSVGTGIGLGAYSLGSASNPGTPQAFRAGTTASGPAAPTSPDSADVPATSGAPASSSLTLDEALAVAAEVAPGRVVEWDEDPESTGLRYDVTLLHDDGTTTQVEVDSVTGQITSVDHDNDRD